MQGSGTYGLDWAKIPSKEQVEATVLASKDGHPKQYSIIFEVAKRTGLRVCEIAHLKCEDLMPGNHLKVTRRKKRVLKPTIIDVFPTLWAVLAEWCGGRTGWMFPGGSRPCIIHRRPKFEETHCPECPRQILRLDQVRKKCDRVTAFANHLTTEHNRTPDEVQEWIEFASKEVNQRVCDGGHLHIRSIQMRFRLVLNQAQAYVPHRGIHSLRHGYAIEMYKATKDLVKVKQLLGHENVTTTQVYAAAVDTAETLKNLDGVV